MWPLRSPFCIFTLWHKKPARICFFSHPTFFFRSEKLKCAVRCGCAFFFVVAFFSLSVWCYRICAIRVWVWVCVWVRLRPVCLMAWQKSVFMLKFLPALGFFCCCLPFRLCVWFLWCFTKYPFIRFSFAGFIFNHFNIKTFCSGKNAYKSKRIVQ